MDEKMDEKTKNKKLKRILEFLSDNIETFEFVIDNIETIREIVDSHNVNNNCQQTDWRGRCENPVYETVGCEQGDCCEQIRVCKKHYKSAFNVDSPSMSRGHRCNVHS